MMMMKDNKNANHHYRTSGKDLVIPPQPKNKTLVSFLVRILFLLVPFKSRFKTYRKACGGRWSPVEKLGDTSLSWVQVPTCPTKLFGSFSDNVKALKEWQRWFHAKNSSAVIPTYRDAMLKKVCGTDFYNRFPCHSHATSEELENGKCYCEVYDDATE